MRKRLDYFAELGFEGGASIRDFVGGPVDSRVVEYLRAGRNVAASSGVAYDVLDPGHKGMIGTTDEMTDGEWCWIQALPYYVETYGLILPEAFLRHAAANGWKPR